VPPSEYITVKKNNVKNTNMHNNPTTKCLKRYFCKHISFNLKIQMVEDPGDRGRRFLPKYKKTLTDYKGVKPDTTWSKLLMPWKGLTYLYSTDIM
jgi:hypothetical protein